MYNVTCPVCQGRRRHDDGCLCLRCCGLGWYLVPVPTESDLMRILPKPPPLYAEVEWWGLRFLVFSLPKEGDSDVLA